jgi:glutamate synthase (NADPH/NADH) small chain
MGRVGAFIKVPRQDPPERDPAERIRDLKEFVGTLPLVELREQGARCMECGVPFCHDGCPLGNLIPDWNDLVYRDRWEEAIQQLHRTNNFPEFTRCRSSRSRWRSSTAPGTKVGSCRNRLRSAAAAASA